VVRGIGPSEWIEEETIQLPGYDARLGPSVRVRTSTVAAADGGRNTVEEVEALNPAAPTEPFRVTRRTVIAVRRIGPDRWATERQVFVRDVNGRMRASQTETEESTAP
jgi:sarcosine oxidase gamma subunit